jgi:hypothetical protein
LRTKPRDKEWVQLSDKGTRDMFIYDLDIGPGMAPTLVPPGQYSIVIKTNGREVKKNVQVLKDPNTKSSLADIGKQYAFGMEIYKSVNTCLGLIDEMEKARAELLEKSKDPKTARTAKPLEDKIYNLEGKIFDVHLTGARQDIFRNPAGILERIFAIAKEGQTASADFPPTDQQLEVFSLLKNRLEKVESDFEALKKGVEWKKSGL